MVNASNNVSNDDAAEWSGAVAKQLALHVCPVWGLLLVTLRFMQPGQAPPDGAAVIYLIDKTPVKDALGYHDEEDGVVVGYVDVPKTLANGQTVSEVLSHEAGELVLDPDANLWADGPEPTPRRKRAFECWDPVQGCTYQIDGVTVGAFVTPAWFDPQSTGAWAFPDGTHVPGPLQVAPNGYMVVTNVDGSWTEEFGEHVTEPMREHCRTNGRRRRNAAKSAA